jgi:hypothetical protein
VVINQLIAELRKVLREVSRKLTGILSGSFVILSSKKICKNEPVRYTVSEIPLLKIKAKGMG